MKQSPEDRAKSHQYYLDNREKMIERATQWRKDNPEQYKAQQREYQEKNKEKIKARQAAWYEKNRKERLEYQNAWNAEHRQTQPNRKQYTQTYFDKHPERKTARERIKHAIKIGKLPRPTSLECAHCGTPADGYHHHNGYGPDHYLDVIPLCTQCHAQADRLLRQQR